MGPIPEPIAGAAARPTAGGAAAEAAERERIGALLWMMLSFGAVFGMIATFVVGAVRDQDVTGILVFFASTAVVAGVVSRWIWRYRGTPLGLPLLARIMAFVEMFVFVPFLLVFAMMTFRVDVWGSLVNLLLACNAAYSAISFWRTGVRRSAFSSPASAPR